LVSAVVNTFLKETANNTDNITAISDNYRDGSFKKLYTNISENFGKVFSAILVVLKVFLKMIVWKHL